jgi:hypothetical protein
MCHSHIGVEGNKMKKFCTMLFHSIIAYPQNQGITVYQRFLIACIIIMLRLKIAPNRKIYCASFPDHAKLDFTKQNDSTVTWRLRLGACDITLANEIPSCPILSSQFGLARNDTLNCYQDHNHLQWQK